MPDLRCLFLVSDPDIIESKLASRGLAADRYHATSVPNDEVPAWLAASDLGIALRDDVLVNNVVSPIKIAEYPASGLPVITSRGVGDYSETIERLDLGVLIEGAQDEDLNRLMACITRAAGRGEACRDYALDRLAWGAHSDLYERIGVNPGARP